MLDVASDLVAIRRGPWAQAAVYLRPQGPGDWTARLLASDTPDGIDKVVRGEADVAIVNPSGPLTVAYRGKGIYREPQPVRVISVLPSYDQLVFGVKAEAGVSTVEEIFEKRLPLRISMRGQADHSTHFVVRDVLEAIGTSWDELKSWGGRLIYQAGMATDENRSGSAARGEIDGLFDEGVHHVMEVLKNNAWSVLSLREETIEKLEVMGYRRALITRKEFPYLSADVPTIDFSGWPIFCHEKTGDDLVTAFCTAFDARGPQIPHEYAGGLPVERMCFDTPEGPLDVPLHPAAERFWRARGYI